MRLLVYRDSTLLGELFSLDTGVSLDAIATELSSLRELIAENLSEVTNRVGSCAREFLPAAKQLHEHLLQELEQRVSL